MQFSFHEVALPEPEGGLDSGAHLRPPPLLLPPQEEGEGLGAEEEHVHHLPPPVPQRTHRRAGYLSQVGLSHLLPDCQRLHEYHGLVKGLLRRLVLVLFSPSNIEHTTSLLTCESPPHYLQETVDSDLLKRPHYPSVELLDQRNGTRQKVQGGTFQVASQSSLN